MILKGGGEGKACYKLLSLLLYNNVYNAIMELLPPSLLASVLADYINEKKLGD